jgi:hypothetical protein
MLARMERREHFGRRAAPQRDIPRGKSAIARTSPPPEPTEILQPIIAQLDLHAVDNDLDRELEEWKATLKLRKRSFREPWRSFSIAAGVAFGLGSFILPPGVADIVNYVTLGLAVASVIAGYRRPKG